jgi:hypothetical protein
LEIPLIQVAQVIAQVWIAAEQETIRMVAEGFRAPNEENLTFLFSGALRMMVDQASDTQQIESAFLEDLRAAIPILPKRVTGYVRGLIARVTFHGHWHEGMRSASDLGVVITRPVAQMTSGALRIEFRRDHGTGLLAQAKIGHPAKSNRKRFKWDTLTDAQVRMFPKHRDYYSLLLYRLKGRKQNEVAPFSWQLCKGRTSRSVKQWLRTDAFPQELSSPAILARLFARSIGTEDPDVLSRIVDPTEPHVHALELHVFWPEGSGPPPSVSLSEWQEERHRVQQRIQA